MPPAELLAEPRDEADTEDDAEAAMVVPPPVPRSTLAIFDVACLAPRFREAAGSHAQSVEVVSADHAERLRDFFVPENVPALLTSALVDWPPVERWADDAYLRSAAPNDATLAVRRTESLRAESGAYESDELPWADLVDEHAAAEREGRSAAHYAAQVRLRSSLPRLFADTHPIPPCVGALGALWRNAPAAYFGCGHASPLHFDQLENVLCVARGRKHVTLWHPGDAGLLYPREGGGAAFSRADVYEPDYTSFPLLREAAKRALHVELRAGDALYIPCCWWHAVRTPVGERSISVSYWAQQPAGKAVEPAEEEGDDPWD